MEPLWRAVISEAWLSYRRGGWGVGAAATEPGGAVTALAGNNCIRTGDDTVVHRHAEIEVLNQLTVPQRTKCTVYSSLEPCILCLGALTLLRVPAVTFLARDFSFSAGWRHLRQAPILGQRVPASTGPVLNELATFARLISMVAEVENGLGTGTFGLEGRLAPALEHLARECVQDGLFGTASPEPGGWVELLETLRHRLAAPTEELRGAEARMSRVGIL